MSTKHGRIWQTADNIEQAQEWADLYLQRGAFVVELKPREIRVPGKEAEDLLVDVIVEVPLTGEDVENPVLQYKIGADEWMTPLRHDHGTTVYVKWDDDTIRVGTIAGYRSTTTIREGKEATDEEYLVKWLTEGEQWVPERDIEVHIERMTLHFNN